MEIALFLMYLANLGAMFSIIEWQRRARENGW